MTITLGSEFGQDIFIKGLRPLVKNSYHWPVGLIHASKVCHTTKVSRHPKLTHRIPFKMIPRPSIQRILYQKLYGHVFLAIYIHTQNKILRIKNYTECWQQSTRVNCKFWLNRSFFFRYFHLFWKNHLSANFKKR